MKTGGKIELKREDIKSTNKLTDSVQPWKGEGAQLNGYWTQSKYRTWNKYLEHRASYILCTPQRIWNFPFNFIVSFIFYLQFFFYCHDFYWIKTIIQTIQNRNLIVWMEIVDSIGIGHAWKPWTLQEFYGIYQGL